MNDTINQVTDKNVGEGLLLMAINLVFGKSEHAEKLSDLQVICYNLNEQLRVHEHYTSKYSILIKNPPFDLRKWLGGLNEKRNKFLGDFQVFFRDLGMH